MFPSGKRQFRPRDTLENFINGTYHGYKISNSSGNIINQNNQISELNMSNQLEQNDSNVKKDTTTVNENNSVAEGNIQQITEEQKSKEAGIQIEKSSNEKN